MLPLALKAQSRILRIQYDTSNLQSTRLAAGGKWSVVVARISLVATRAFVCPMGPFVYPLNISMQPEDDHTSSVV